MCRTRGDKPLSGRFGASPDGVMTASGAARRPE
jgi:hypothetical protein